MHSRVFQLEKNLDYCKDYYLTECDLEGDGIYPSFVGLHADYVSDNTDMVKDIEWFISSLEDFKDYIEITKKNNCYFSIKFKKGFKEKYFEKPFKSFVKEINKLNIKDFCDSFKIYKLKESLEDSCGFYFYQWEEGIKSEDSFIRDLPDKDIVYYFGNTLDYHF